MAFIRDTEPNITISPEKYDRLIEYRERYNLLIDFLLECIYINDFCIYMDNSAPIRILEILEPDGLAVRREELERGY